MKFGAQLGERLRVLRRVDRQIQEDIARAVGSSFSAISRFERGLRILRLDQLIRWAQSLGCRIDVVLWKPALPDQQWGEVPPDKVAGLDDGCATVLSAVARGVSCMPDHARQGLIEEMELYVQAALARRALDVADSTATLLRREAVRRAHRALAEASAAASAIS